MTTTRRCDDVDASSANEAESQHSSTAGSASMKHKEGKFRSRRHRHRRCSAVDVRVVTNTCIRAHKHACMMNESYACVCVCAFNEVFSGGFFVVENFTSRHTQTHTHARKTEKRLWFSDNFKVEVWSNRCQSHNWVCAYVCVCMCVSFVVVCFMVHL